MHSNSSVLLTSLPRAVIDHEAERASLARIQRQLYIILFTRETFSLDEKWHSVACCSNVARSIKIRLAVPLQDKISEKSISLNSGKAYSNLLIRVRPSISLPSSLVCVSQN